MHEVHRLPFALVLAVLVSRHFPASPGETSLENCSWFFAITTNSRDSPLVKGKCQTCSSTTRLFMAFSPADTAHLTRNILFNVLLRDSYVVNQI
jgi:hypothetical protein